MTRARLAIATLLLGSCGRLSFEIRDDGLVAWFEMEDEGDVIRDSTSNQLDGTCVPGPCPPRVAGVSGTAIACDGTSSFVVPNDPRLQLDAGFTIALWVAREGGTTPIAKPQQTGPGGSYELVLFDGEVWYCTDPDPGSGGEDCMVTPSAVGTAWVHYAMTWDGVDKRLHVDGVEIARKPVTTVFDERELVICADAEAGPGTVTTPLIGAIDDVRIYRRALAAGEIEALALL